MSSKTQGNINNYRTIDNFLISNNIELIYTLMVTLIYSPLHCFKILRFVTFVLSCLVSWLFIKHNFLSFKKL